MRKLTSLSRKSRMDTPLGIFGGPALPQDALKDSAKLPPLECLTLVTKWDFSFGVNSTGCLGPILAARVLKQLTMIQRAANRIEEVAVPLRTYFVPLTVALNSPSPVHGSPAARFAVGPRVSSAHHACVEGRSANHCDRSKPVVRPRLPPTLASPIWRW